MPIGIGAGQARGDFRAIDRLAQNAEILLDHGDVEAAEMEDLGDARIGQHAFQVGRGILARAELNEVRRAIAGRHLDQAQPVAQRIEAEGFGIDGNAVAEAEIGRNVALIKFDLNGNGRAPCGR